MDSPKVEVVGMATPKKSMKSGKGLAIALSIVFVLAAGLVVGLVLIRQSQTVEKEASQAEVCPQAEACPDNKNPNVLKNCHPSESDGSPKLIYCNLANVVTFCGNKYYCCPVAGGSWTNDLSLCPQVTATPIVTVTQTPLATSTSLVTMTPTATSTSSSQVTTAPTATTVATAASGTATAVPVPVTGVSWPSIVGIGLGILVIATSIMLAL